MPRSTSANEGTKLAATSTESRTSLLQFEYAKRRIRACQFPRIVNTPVASPTLTTVLSELLNNTMALLGTQSTADTSSNRVPSEKSTRTAPVL
eukprot:5186799-Prymnesium_polylepis.4